MEITDLEINEIYHLNLNDKILIFKFKGINNKDIDRPIANFISNFNGNGLEYKRNHLFWFPNRNCRLATQSEKNWLNQCIQADEFIPFENTIQNKIYEIWN